MYKLVLLEGISVSNFKNQPQKWPHKWPEKRPEKQPEYIEFPPWKMSLSGSPPPEYPVDHVGSGATPASVPTQRTAFRETQSGLVAFVEFWVAI